MTDLSKNIYNVDKVSYVVPNFPGKKFGLHCTDHKLTNMEDIKNKKC